MTTAPDLSPRQRQLLNAFVMAWEASSHTPFDLDDGTPFEHPNWPPGVATPGREEIRPLVHLGFLHADYSVAPAWRVFPSPEARHLAGVATDEALADPDGRLGLILEATVAAFEADPSQPLQFSAMFQADLVEHPHWPLQPDVVRAHDLQQLEDLRLIATAGTRETMTFWPTIHGRAAAKDAIGYLERLARETDDEGEKSRLRRWAAHLRAGDVAVGTTASTSGVLIRALLGQ
jgi:hypothetical protein